jgi:hypothetical protein
MGPKTTITMAKGYATPEAAPPLVNIKIQTSSFYILNTFSLRLWEVEL